MPHNTASATGTNNPPPSPGINALGSALKQAAQLASFGSNPLELIQKEF